MSENRIDIVSAPASEATSSQLSVVALCLAVFVVGAALTYLTGPIDLPLDSEIALVGP